MMDERSRARSSQFAPPPDAVDRIVEGLLMVLLVFLPMAYGGVTASGHFVLIGTVMLMSLLVGMRGLLSKQGRLAWSTACIPLFLFLGLVALQSVPMGLSLMAALSPGNADVWTAMLSEPQSHGGIPSALPLSLYPHASRVDLAVLSAFVALFFVVLQVYRSLDQVKRFLTLVSLMGLFVASVAFVQHLTGSASVMGLWDMPTGTHHGGPFVHVGHFSQFINLSMGAALALMLVRLAERLPGRSWEAKELVWGTGNMLGRWGSLLLILLVLGSVMVAMSHSRNGLLSLLVSGAVTTVVLSRTNYLKGIAWPLIGLSVLSLLALLLMGFDPVYERLATLEDPGGQIESRFALIGDSLELWKTSPWLGVGQGSFASVFPGFDLSLRPGTAAHAENQYVELLVETGVFGFVLLLTFLGVLTLSWWRLLRACPAPRAGVAYGLGFGLLAVALHATTDFGLRNPAVMLLAITSAGMTVVTARPKCLGGVSGRGTVGGLGLAMALLLGFQVLPAFDRWRAEQGWEEVQWWRWKLQAPRLAGTADELDGFVDKVQRVSRLDADNIEFRFAYILHRWQREVARVRSSLDLAAGDSVPRTPSLVRVASGVRQDLLDARRLMPSHGRLWSMLGQIGVEWLDDPASEQWIWRGQELSPHDAATNLAAGRQALRNHQDVDAVRYLRRSIVMGAAWKGILRVLLIRESGTDLARRVAHGNAHRLQWLALQPEFLAKASKEDREALHIELKGLLERAVLEGQARAWTYRALAQQELRMGKDSLAIPLLRQHLRMEPRSAMRVELARALSRMGKTESAISEVRTWLRSHPADAKARRLLLELRDKSRR